MPRIVRGYLAERFEHGWPRSGRAKTPWEKLETAGAKWKAVEGDLADIAERIFDAAIDVQYRWIYRNYCHFRRMGSSRRKTVDTAYQ